MSRSSENSILYRSRRQMMNQNANYTDSLALGGRLAVALPELLQRFSTEYGQTMTQGSMDALSINATTPDLSSTHICYLNMDWVGAI